MTPLERPPVQAEDDQYLDEAGALAEIHAMGFGHVKARQVERMADDKKLPFFSLGRKRYIERKELRASFKRLQLERIRAIRPSKEVRAR